MRNNSFLIQIALFLIVGFSTNVVSQNKFVGVQKCAMCHKAEKYGNQIKKWESDPHSKAFNTLQTAKADKIAKEKGYKTKAAETPECLDCHVPQHNLSANLLTKDFNFSDGVQCESCHGAGSEYKAMPIMKDHAKAVKNGLIDYKNEKDIEKMCVSCHNPKSPAYKPFNFKEMWTKIQHPIPNKK